MKYLVLGTGLQGRIVGYDIFESESDSVVTFADWSDKSLELAAARVKEYSNRTYFKKIDLLNIEDTASLMEKNDVIIIAVPHNKAITTSVFEAMVKVGNKKAVVSDFWFFDLMQSYNDELAEAGGLCVPGLGIAPGYANICVGQLEHEFDKLEEARIYVGGFPVEKNRKAFNYMELYNLDAMLDMYTTPVRVIEGGKFVQKDPLTVVEHILIPGHGEFEAYYTDGLNSLGDNMLNKGVIKCDEVTLRHPGHAAKMREILDYGFLDSEEIEVQGVKIRPRDFTEKVFQKLWVNEPEIQDMTYLYVLGKGIKDGRFTKKAYELKTYNDEDTGITSMELATAYPISIAAMMLARDKSGMKGVVDPENVFIGDNFLEMTEELGKRDVNVYEYNY